MIIGITGATGFIGRHLIDRLRVRGDDCVAFSRQPERPVHGCRETRVFAPDRPLDLGGLDGIVNLAGESIMGLWTQAKRRRIIDSRVATTTRLVETLGKSAGAGPRMLVNASAIGYYGDRGDEVLTESSAPGSGFLPELTRQWEAAADGGENAALRVARVRIGFVLGADGGALPLLRRVFNLGLGGKLGSGRQWMSLVHIEDVVGLMIFLLDDLSAEGSTAGGAFNAVSPTPARNAEFTRALAQTLGRPAVLPLPALTLRALLGEMSQLMLMSERVLPARTLEAGYRFAYPQLDQMLAETCRRLPVALCL
jgi:uncharacterized protein (TIGR01777 family)